VYRSGGIDPRFIALDSQSQSQSQSQSYFTTDSQSVCLGVEPNLGLLTRDFFFFKVTVLSFGGALSDERSGLSFASTIAGGEWSASRSGRFTSG
jgi:hypothetical protein